MKQNLDEISQLTNPFFRRFYMRLKEKIGNGRNVAFRIYGAQNKYSVDVEGIDKRTVLILWGDEYSQVFPVEYFDKAGFILKCYCPEAWIKKGIIPITDNAMISGDDNPKPSLCSSRPYTIMYSANLNYRRTDLFRGVMNRSYGYPFRISSNYPTTGQYPLWHKVEAVAMHKIITFAEKKRDFSDLYPNSYIRFHGGFMKGALPQEEYMDRLLKSKISWCTAGFMTNETSRLIESSYAGCAVMCGKLPETSPIYKGHPFLVVNDWRKVRKITDELLNDSARIDELGVKARAWYDSHFCPEKQAERVASIILS